MVAPRFSPGVRRAITVDVSAALFFTFFAGLTGPFTGLILRRELGATPLQLSVMSAAAGACLLLSLVWARALHGRAPLPYLVWPSFLARAVFLLVPFAAAAWLVAREVRRASGDEAVRSTTRRLRLAAEGGRPRPAPTPSPRRAGSPR
jgi:uncharacterized membrane protein